MPLVPAALIWQSILDPTFGLLNYLTKVGATTPQSLLWSQDPASALVVVIGIQIWVLTPLAMIMYLAAIQNIPEELYEAARVDGAGAWSTFKDITLPAVVGTTVILVLVLGTWAFGRAFTIIYLVTSGGPADGTRTLTLLTYQRAFQQLEFGEASALATLVFIIGLLFAAGLLSYARRRTS
jgi:multiple sugar transport system permease protein